MLPSRRALCRLRGTLLKERQRRELRDSDKSFAQLMASDPASLADEFSQLAARNGVALPAKD